MWLNLIAFNIAWLGLVILGNAFVIIAGLWLTAHIYFAQQPWQELSLIFAVAIIGIAVDTTLTSLGFFQFSPSHLLPAFHSSMTAALAELSVGLIPLWLATLWACFAATIGHSLSFLARSRFLQLGLGAIFPPLSYLAGQRLGAVTFSLSELYSFFILSIVWSPLLALFVYLKRQIDVNGVADV